MTDPASSEQLRDEPFRAPVLVSGKVFQGRVWDVLSDTVSYGDGEMVRQYVAHPGAVAVLALDAEDRVLLIQQYRHPIRHRDWEIPAGLLDVVGENTLTAAQRELAEEADLVAEHWQPLVSIFTTPGGNDEVIHLYLARVLSAAQSTFVREEEEADIRVEWVPLDEVVDAIAAGRMRNGTLVTGVLMAAEVLRRESAR